MVGKVRVVLEYELGSFPAHQQLPSHGQAPARRPLTFALGVAFSTHPGVIRPSMWVSLNPPSLRIILSNAGSKLAMLQS